MKFFTKKLITCALVCALSISPLGVLSASAADASSELTVSGSSEFDKSSIDDSWSNRTKSIYYSGTYVGLVRGHYYDNLVTDKVQASCESSTSYYRYATVSSKTSASGDTIKTGNAYSGKVTLANNKAIFAGVIHVS